MTFLAIVFLSLCFVPISGQAEMDWETQECADEDMVQMMQVSLSLRSPPNSPSIPKSDHKDTESPPLSNQNVTTNEFPQMTLSDSAVSIVTSVVEFGSYVFDGLAMLAIAVFFLAAAFGNEISFSKLCDVDPGSSSPSSALVQNDMPYYCHSGEQPGCSWRTLTYPQLKVMASGFIFYKLGIVLYKILANILVYITIHHVPPNSPSYAGDIGQLGAISQNFQHKEMFDLGFQMVTDWSVRPAWMLMFTHLQVAVAQRLPLVLLVYQGQAYGFVSYVGITTILFVLKGFIQLMTLLPPANHGAECWDRNYDPWQLTVIKEQPFSVWGLGLWGTLQGCNDMLWSGHTCNSVVAFLYVNNMLKHLSTGWIIALRSLLVLYALGYLWLILACRMHYTVDVFLAILVSVALCTNLSLCFTLWEWANIIVRNKLSD